MSDQELELGYDDYCFGCGKANPVGLKLDFQEVDGEYVADFTPQREHQGYTGVAHGGILATVLDEAIARFAWSRGDDAVTAQITVKLRRPAPTRRKLRVVARLTEDGGRVICGTSEIRDEEGALIAEATAKLVRVRLASPRRKTTDETRNGSDATCNSVRPATGSTTIANSKHVPGAGTSRGRRESGSKNST